jgi:UDPglucose--hexose-1-phosphate uridylyltransferase
VFVRRHPLTGESILFAPERASRPRAFDEEAVERCPFCPGHEDDTPPTLAQIGDPWRVRVFANKYPPVAGAEVIVESPGHEGRFETIPHAEDVVRMYVERYRAHAGTASYVAVFKNEGTRAGASIPHVHSQVVPLPFVPPRVQRELAGFADGCPLCAPQGHRIRETQSYVWLAPEASSFAYQQWIVPKGHVAEMTALPDLDELAQLLRDAARATGALGAYNWTFMNFPSAPKGHAYVDLTPRLAALAGLELGTGTFVEIIDPADAARELQQRLRQTS